MQYEIKSIMFYKIAVLLPLLVGGGGNSSSHSYLHNNFLGDSIYPSNSIMFLSVLYIVS